MNVARSTYYDQPQQAVDDTAIVETIFGVCDEFESYGYRRVGLIVNDKKIRRLMREHDLQPTHRRRFIATTDSAHDGPIFPDLAKELAPHGPNQLWVGDIRYVALPGRLAYVAIILDAWSRLVVGYGIARSIDARLTVAALKVALAERRRRAVSIIPIAAHNTRRSHVVNCSPPMACMVRWADPATRTTMRRLRAS
jgi:putative transposase